MNGFNEEMSKLISDPTRMKIYRAVMDARGEAVTVAEVAQDFGLHPNVARLHLEKLAGAGLLVSSYRKRNGSGRPAKQYFLGEKVLSVQFPPRDYKLLAELSLAALGDDTRTGSAARKKGREIGVNALASAGFKTDKAKNADLVDILEKLAEELGLYSKITSGKKGKIEVNIFNCVFKELSRKDEKVCRLHQNLFLGICESLFGKIRISVDAGIAQGGNQCCFNIDRRGS